MLGFAAVPVSKSRAKDRRGMRGYKDDPIRSVVLLVLILVPVRGGAVAPFLRYLEGTQLALGL